MRLTTKAQRLQARSFYIPEGAREQRHDDLQAVVYQYERNGRPYALAFAGTAGKPAFHYRFQTDDRRQAYIARWLEGRRAHVEARAKRQTSGHQLQVGHVLYATWGYDQTNVDFYQVVRVISDRTVVVREIAHSVTGTGHDSGHAVPLIDQFIKDAPELRRRAGPYGVRIDDVRRAHVWSGRPVFCSWYR